MTSFIAINSKLKTQNSKLESLDWQKMDGLVPAIIQQADSGAVLMLGYMNERALALTEETGRVHFWSRSRNELWLKGEKSGNYLLVVDLQADCDGDALLVRVRAATGSTAVCHTGAATCFDAPTATNTNPLPASPEEGGVISATANADPLPTSPEGGGVISSTTIADPLPASPEGGGVISSTTIADPLPTSPEGGGVISSTTIADPLPAFPKGGGVISSSQHSALSTLVAVVAQLMGPHGCPWDMAQTHTSLKPNLLEETYEALDALDALGVEDDIPRERKLAKLVDELGDLLGQVVYQAQIGATNGEFTLNDIVVAVAGKLVRRHPHVFADTQASGVDEALTNWEEIKKIERASAGEDKTVGAGLRGIPPSMPALHFAQQVQGRVKRSSYVWPERDAILTHVGERLTAIARPGAEMDALSQMGDLLWQVVLLARSFNVNAEEALRLTARKFINDYRD